MSKIHDGIINSNLSQYVSNQTNLSLADYCKTPQTFYTSEQFFKCYDYFAKQKPVATFFEILLSCGTVFSNLLVVICIVFGSKKKTCFDKILFGCCIVDGVTGLIDIPLYHCYVKKN